jgi:hypothetical protein
LNTAGVNARKKILQNYTFEKHYQDEKNLFELLAKGQLK